MPWVEPAYAIVGTIIRLVRRCSDPGKPLPLAWR
jgi:hypothetical protein